MCCIYILKIKSIIRVIILLFMIFHNFIHDFKSLLCSNGKKKARECNIYSLVLNWF